MDPPLDFLTLNLSNGNCFSGPKNKTQEDLFRKTSSNALIGALGKMPWKSGERPRLCVVIIFLKHSFSSSPQPGFGRGREGDGIPMREGCGKGTGIHLQYPHSRYFFSSSSSTLDFNQYKKCLAADDYHCYWHVSSSPFRDVIDGKNIDLNHLL